MTGPIYAHIATLITQREPLWTNPEVGMPGKTEIEQAEEINRRNGSHEDE